jgi:hypothetical protein
MILLQLYLKFYLFEFDSYVRLTFCVKYTYIVTVCLYFFGLS